MNHCQAEVIELDVYLNKPQLCLILELNKPMLIREFHITCNALVCSIEISLLY